MNYRENPPEQPDANGQQNAAGSEPPSDSSTPISLDRESLNSSIENPLNNLPSARPISPDLSIRFVFKDSVDRSAWPVLNGIEIHPEAGSIQASWLNEAQALRLLRLKPGDDNTVSIWRASDVIPERKLGILPATRWIDQQESFLGKLRDTESLRRVVVRNSHGQVFLIPAETVQFFTGSSMQQPSQFTEGN